MIALKNISSCFDNNLRHVLPPSKQFSQWCSFRQRAGLTPLSKAGGTPKPHGSGEPAGLSPCLRRPRLYRHLLFTAAAPISSPGPAESHRSRGERAPAWRPAPLQRWVPGSPGCGHRGDRPAGPRGRRRGRDTARSGRDTPATPSGATRSGSITPRAEPQPLPPAVPRLAPPAASAPPRSRRRAQGRPLQGGRTRCSPGTGPGGFGGQRGAQGPGAKHQPAGSETGKPVRPGHVEQGGGSEAGAPSPRSQAGRGAARTGPALGAAGGVSRAAPAPPPERRQVDGEPSGLRVKSVPGYERI